MAKFSRTWWGKRFLEALEAFSDEKRLGRGRSYARHGKIIEHDLTKGKITAKVKGSINPYFGVYKEPLYQTIIEIKPISATNWAKIIKHLGKKAGTVSRLLMNEVPENIEEVFAELNLHFLPNSSKDFKTSCSCPDYANPCKHVAGVYYFVAAQLDDDPLLLFELRGLSRDKLQQELAKSPLGRVLSSAVESEDGEIEFANSYYTRPKSASVPKSLDLNGFWHGSDKLSPTVETAKAVSVPAILIKKAGDFPLFWKKEISFIEVMEDFYQRVRTKNKGVMW